MSSSAIKLETTTAASVSRPAVSRMHLLWIAVFLWVASNIFVTSIAKFASWEGSASYKKVSDLCQWDCGWYASVLQHGYDRVPENEPGEANWPFHPLFPMTAYPFWRWLNLPLAASMVLTSKLELLFALYAFLLLVRDQIDTTNEGLLAGSLVAFNPYVIYAHAGYSEPLYFGLITLGFYFADRRRWILSGAMGGLASATRFVGFLLSISYAIVWRRELRARSAWRKLNLDAIIGLLLCPLGTALFLLYLHAHMGDALVQQHAQVAWHKLPGNPVHTLWISLTAHRWPRLWGFMVVVALALSAWLVKIQKAEMGIFLALSILLPLSATFWCIPRYIWWEPPLLYAVYRILKHHPRWWLLYLSFASGFAAFMIVEWFSGHSFVM